MTVSSWRDLLLEPAARRHLVLIYETENYLQATVATWIAGSLTSGGGALLVGRPQETEGILRQLRLMGIDVARRLETGRLVVMDASDTLAELIQGARIDADKFRDSIRGALGTIRAACATPDADVRAWGEMVNLLQARGEGPLAVDLERQWEDLLGYERVRLLCSYQIGNLPRIQESFTAHDSLLVEAPAGLEKTASILVGATVPDPVGVLLSRGAIALGGSTPRALLVPLDALRREHGLAR